MITEEDEAVTTAEGVFPNHMELNEFLEALNDSGLSRLLHSLPESGAANQVTLRIKSHAQFVFMKALDEGALQKWGDQFKFKATA